MQILQTGSRRMLMVVESQQPLGPGRPPMIRQLRRRKEMLSSLTMWNRERKVFNILWVFESISQWCRSGQRCDSSKQECVTSATSIDQCCWTATTTNDRRHNHWHLMGIAPTSGWRQCKQRRGWLSSIELIEQRQQQQCCAARTKAIEQWAGCGPADGECDNLVGWREHWCSSKVGGGHSKLFFDYANSNTASVEHGTDEEVNECADEAKRKKRKRVAMSTHKPRIHPSPFTSHTLTFVYHYLLNNHPHGFVLILSHTHSNYIIIILMYPQTHNKNHN